MIVERAENGQQALDLFQARPQGYFDLILMDVNMPVKDGMTAVRELRGLDREDARSVLIFAMTANTFQEDREAAVRAWMISCRNLLKWINFITLCAAPCGKDEPRRTSYAVSRKFK